ncbi:ATP/GTP-binding protein [Xanthomonas sp. Leaf131]|nr:ATP/GTP-binding protein [Xanthomonas sp. Leaf131]
MSNIQISNIVLWQKNGIKRTLDFLHNRVNVITGDSGKGKSSVLFIIDYCLLASETTGISKTNIDSKVDWYGIKISVDGKELFIARPSESNGAADQAYFSENGVVPSLPVLNVRIDNLRKVLSSAFGIDTDLRVPYGGRYIQAGSKVSFRNFIAYSYQDQNTIVAPDHLYIRPTDGRYQEAIERTFRMAIGAENVDTAISRNRLAELERKKAIQTRKNESYKKSAHAFSEEVGTLSSEAYSLGVIEHIPESYEENINVLYKLVQTPATPSDHKREVERIEREIFSLTAKNRQLQAFIDDRPAYTGALKETEDSLKPVNAFNSQADSIFPSQLANEVIARLQRELSDIKSSLRSRKSFPFLEEVKTIHARNINKIHALKEELSAIEARRPIQYNPNDYYRYLGRLEAKLEMYGQSEDQDFEAPQDDFEESIADLQRVVDQNEEKSTLAKQELNRLINKRLTKLPLKGYNKFSAFYYEKEKLIHLHSPDLATIEKMPDVGSASNYLYLHVSYFLAIHEIAKTRKIPWIPSFLVLDQVSTPYFSSDGKPNDDIRSLDKVLTELNQFVIDMDERGGFQIILLEHIDKEHWSSLELDRFHLVDRELRDDYGLILD